MRATTNHRPPQSEVAKRYLHKLEAAIADGMPKARDIVQRVQSEMPKDRLVDSRGVSFDYGSRSIMHMASRDGQLDEPVQPFAFGQVVERAGMPMDYTRKLEEQGLWGKSLIAHNLNETWKNQPNKRVLVRSVNKGIRGVLSDKFKRLDSRPIVDAFTTAAQEQGALPLEGYGSESRWTLKAVIPRVWEPFPGEVVAYGISIANSDYGNGALSLREFILRCWCINLHAMEELLREIHLGGRLTEGVLYSDETINADTKASMLATRDIVRQSLTEEKMDEKVALVKLAHEKKIDNTKEFFKSLPKLLNLLKGEMESVQEVYNTGGVEELPPGNTLYRMSNAISWVARNKASTPERRMELEHAAGKLLLQAAA